MTQRFIPNLGIYSCHGSNMHKWDQRQTNYLYWFIVFRRVANVKNQGVDFEEKKKHYVYQE